MQATRTCNMFTSWESFGFVGYDKLTYETEDLVSRTLTGVSIVLQGKKRETNQDVFQSLAQINVGHLHSVPFSLFPVGPTGLWQIQNARPQLTPGFFVVKLMQGSWWPSHLGGGFLLNSFVQSSLLATGSITVSLSWDDGGGFVGVVGPVEMSSWRFFGWLDEDLDEES